MSAFLMCPSSDGCVHIFADGAITEYRTGHLGGIVLKTFAAPAKPGFAWTSVGSCLLVDLLALKLKKRDVKAIDQFMALAPELTREVVDYIGERDQYSQFNLAAAGYSEAKGRVVGFSISHSDLMPGVAPFVAEEGETHMSPGPRPLENGEMNFDWPSPLWDSKRVVEWGIAGMEAMRNLPNSFYKSNDESWHSIGGHIQHVVVSKTGIEASIVHVWPDWIGRLIDPARALTTVADRAPVPMSQAAHAMSPMGLGYGAFSKYGVTALLGAARR
jgi:hypothetical protein